MNYKGLCLTLTAANVAPDSQSGAWPLETTSMWLWDKNDPSPPYTPQGITSFVDGTTGQEVVVVSWHSDTDGGDARISYLMSADDGSGNYLYGHARLGDAGTTAKLHAGGVAFFDNQLLVADTSHGVIAYDVTNPRQIDKVDWRVDWITNYDLDAGNPALERFSFTDVDWTDPENPLLLTGVYVNSKGSTTHQPSVLGWPLAAGKGPSLNSPTVFLDSTPTSPSFKTFWYMQGVAHYGNRWYLSQSGGIDSIGVLKGDLSSKSPKFDKLVTTDLGLEDLHIPPGGQYLWGLTENVDAKGTGDPRPFFRITL